MESFFIKPILGLKTNVPSNDETLYQAVGGKAATHATGGENFDITRTRNSTTKAFGRTQWSENAVPMTTTGSNLITNGADWTAATGATPPTGWAVVNAGTFTITGSGQAGNCLKIEVDATPTANPTITDAITTVTGKTYKLSYYFKGGDATDGKVYIGTTSGGNETYDSGALNDADWTEHTYEFKATATTTYISLVVTSGTATEYELFDTVTLYELTATSTCYCLGMVESTTGALNHRWSFHGDDSALGVAVRWDSNRYPERVSDVAGHVSATALAFNALDYYSAVDFGGYIIFTDFGEHTPYKADVDDTLLTKLIQSGTEYKFRYLEQFHGRIIGAYSDQTNGDIEIRYTDSLITADPWSALDFAAANQLYRPNDDRITGIKRMGMNACFLYGENSIDRIDYYPNYTTPFAIVNMVTGSGAVANNSIVFANGSHYYFDRNYGFVQYTGGREFKPISIDIEDLIAVINPTYYRHIIGTFIERHYKIVWSVPSGGGPVPTDLFIYDVLTGQWTRESHVARFLDAWVVGTNVTWQDLIDRGYSTWEDFGESYWGDLVTETPKVVFSNDDGLIYERSTESDAGNAWDGFRVEPVMDFGSPNDKDLLLEIWFGLNAVGAFNLYVFHRSGDTVNECIQAGWEALTEVSMNTPANAVCYLNKLGRFHQIKYGSDAANETFSINEIEFKYKRQGRY